MERLILNRPLVAQLVRFGVVGVMNTAWYAVLLYLLVDRANWSAIVANVLAFVLVVVHSFLWNKFWTFGLPGGRWHYQAGWFILINLVGLGASSVVVWLLHDSFGISAAWSGLVAAVVVTVWNFAGYRYLAFRSE